MTPFFSPDGRWLGFAKGSRLMKTPLAGGAPVAITAIPDVDGMPGIAPRVRGASWGTDGTIVFAVGGNAGLWRVPADGGTPRPVTRPDPSKGEVGHRWPQVLPGRAIRALHDQHCGRFVIVEKPPEAPAPRQMVLIPDFARELKQKLRSAGR